MMCEFINWLVVSNGHFRGAVPGSILVKKKISDSCDIIIHNSVNFVAKRGGIVDGEWFGIRKTLLKVSTSHWLPSFLAYLTVSPEDTNIAPHPLGAIENREGYLGCRGPLWGARVPGPHQTPQPQHQWQEEEPPQYLAMKIGRDSVQPGETEESWKPRYPLTRACAQNLSLPDTHLGLQWSDCGSAGARDMQGEPELLDFRTRAERKAVIVPMLSLPPCNQQEDDIFPLLSPSPHSKIWFSLAWWAPITPL